MKGANRPTPSLVVPDSWPKEGGEGGIDGGRDGGANMCLRFDSISYLMLVAEILSPSISVISGLIPCHIHYCTTPSFSPPNSQANV
jgi:hypothetical protein